MTSQIRVFHLVTSGGAREDLAVPGVEIVRSADLAELSRPDEQSFDYVLVDPSVDDAALTTVRDVAACPVIVQTSGSARETLSGLAPNGIRRALAQVSFGVALVDDAEPSIRWANDGFERLTGIGSDDRLDEDWARIVDPDREAEDVAPMLDVERSDVFVVPHEERWLELTPTPLEAGAEVLLIVRDLTDRVERVRALKRQNGSLESLHCATETLLGATDFEQAARSVIEGIAEGLGQDLAGFWLQEEDGRLHPIAASERSEEVIAEPPVFSAGDGSVAWEAFETKDTRYVHEMGEEPNRYNPDTAIGSEIVVPLGEFGVLIVASTAPEAFRAEDITVAELWAATATMVLIRIERERLLRDREREVRRERDRLDEFASLMSHDLRNPLTVANGYLELAARDVDSAHLDRVADALDRIETLITDMLTLAREGWQGGDPEPVALSTAVDRAWGIAATGRASLESDIDATIEADDSQLGQLLENLFDNAATHGGEAVTVRVGRMANGFFVEDDGVGIDPDDRADVLGTGYTTSEDGTGFGLAIVAAIADAHEWDLTVTEGRAGGARFEFHGVTVLDGA